MSNKMSEATHEGSIVLLSTEVELIVQSLATFELDDIASSKWLGQHEHLEKLNMQAILSASANETEYVKDSLVTFEKMPVLVHELISVELWKEKIFPELFTIGFKPKNTFIIYLVLYHEATLVNLMETVCYHQDICQSIGDAILDLIDYCYRKLADCCQNYENFSQEEKPVEMQSDEANTLDELNTQKKKIEFDIFMKTISLLRYIIDNASSFPISVIHRILNTHDFILLLVQLMELQVWTRKNKNGTISKYIDNKWKQISNEERFQLTKIEGQIWLSVYQLLLNPECASKYEYTEFKKNQILKLRSYINEVIIDQIPNLAALQRFLEELSIMQTPVYKPELVIEQVPEIYDRILMKNKGKWTEIAHMQSKTVLNPDEKEMRKQAKKWVDTYNIDVLETLINEAPKCAACGEEATKRCSRCQNEWYCRRECQVKNWSKHKQACNLLYEAMKKVENLTTTDD